MTERGVDSVDSWIPESCTLPSVDRPLRLTQFDELLGSDAVGVHRLGEARVAIDLRPEPAVAARTAELVTRETSCCSFFTFTLTIRAESMVLEISTPPGYISVLDSLVARAELSPGRSV